MALNDLYGNENPDDARRRRMELFSLSDPSDLEDYLLSLKEIPHYVFLKKPSSGMVMVRGRIGGNGKVFNMGEMLISRCIVDVLGLIGYGYTPYENLRHSEMAALLDALSLHPDYSSSVNSFMELLEERRNELMEDEEREVAKTRVEFFTIKRGEDE
jgi:alpha-D-ribose 1-methylphosphonate 5-triphosphate synthase subunit PhnG